MTMETQRLSTVRVWILCWYIQFTGFLLSVIQFNNWRTLYDLGCLVTSLRLARVGIHALSVLFTLVAYPGVSYVLLKSKPSPFLIASGCASGAVACVLMGASTFGLMGQPGVDRGNISFVEDLKNISQCSPISSPFIETHEPPLWEILLNPTLVISVAAQVLMIFGVAVHYVAGITLIEDVAGGTRSPVVLALLLMALNSAPYISFQIFTPLVPPTADGPVWYKWITILRQGWIPLGVTSLFLTPLALFVTPSRASQGHPPQLKAAPPTQDEIDQNGEESEMKADEKGFIHSLKSVLGNYLVLCNVLSQLFITAAITGISQVQTRLRELLEMNNSGSDVVQEALIKYSRHVNNFGPNMSLMFCGWVIFKLRPRPRRLLMWAAMVLLALLLFSVMWDRQDSDTETSRPQKRVYKISLEATPDDCRCSQLRDDRPPLLPMCSEEGVMFPSDCDAGCKLACIGQNRTKFFTDCSALSSNSSVLSSDQCFADTGWHRHLWFLYIFIVIKSLVSTARVIGVFVSIRCVTHRDRPVSLAVILGGISLVNILDRVNFYAHHLAGLTCLALLFTLFCWYFISPFPLYDSQRSLLGNHISPFLTSGKTKSSSAREQSTFLPRESLVDESELLDVKIMARQRDSIDVTKSKRFRVKRMSLDYRKRSMPDFDEHVVYP